MKKNSLFTAIVLFAALIFAGCSANTADDYSLGATPEVSSITFSATPQSAIPNRVDFSNTSATSGVALWDFGNGSTANGSTASTDYPFAGDYVVTMTLYTKGGSVSTTQTITIANDDFSLLDTPNYRALTGGPDDLDGKTWVLDQYHDGHFGVGPAGDPSTGPSWWACPAMGKDQTSLYTQKYTFIQRDVQFKWENNGYIYSDQTGADQLGLGSVATPQDDYDVPYVPADNLTFSLNETDMTLTLSGNAFIGNYQGVSTYRIVSLSDTEMYLYCASATTPANGWWYRLIPEELNVEPVVHVEVKAVPMADDMEEEKSPYPYTAQEMGDEPNTKRGYDNPLPMAPNTSSKVYFYEKTASFYSNLLLPNQGYKFDLTDQNTIKMKVYLPSYNDYTTEGDVAGDWIAVKNLQKKVVVKLQDSTLGDNAWSTQAEIGHDNLETDKWIELTFDFSAYADRQDFDQIIIQFGGEGHSMPGLFFFDDFSFE